MSAGTWPAATRWTREERSRVMMWRNEAVPRISSAMPGAPGSMEIAAMLGALSARSTRTTRPCSDSARAKAMAVDVVPILRAAPTTVMRLPASPARRSSLASRSVAPPGAPVAAPAGAAATRRHVGTRRSAGDGRIRSGAGAGSGTSGGTKRSAAVAWKAELAAATTGAGSAHGRDRRLGFTIGRAIDVAGEELAGGDEADREEEGGERGDQDDRHLLGEGRGVGDDARAR